MTKIVESPWVNKIVGHGEVSPDELLAHPFNWRIHTRQQQAALAGAINDVGYIRSVTVNKTTGHVIDGHLRVTLALRGGVKSIPVEYVELTEAEEAEALVTIDPIGAMAAADKTNLDALLKQVETGDAAVQEMLSELAKDSGIVESVAAGVDVIPAQWMVLIECKSEQEQNELLQRFIDEGLTCKALTS